jgi:TetR/AcrR family transcriptional repressor of bet genes
MATATARRNPVDKHDARRRALADSALRTLGELGYARSSLREIANNSEFSHGVVHYYFADKLELIVYCVRQYKATCVKRYDGVVADSTTPDELIEEFAGEAPRDDPRRGADAPALVRPALPEHVRGEPPRGCAPDRLTLEDMIWRVVSRYAELSGAEPSMSSHAAYGLLDGLFQ